MLILMAGLPGSGKTTLAQQLAERLWAVVLSKDLTRHTLFPPELIEYSAKQDDFVVDLLLQTAEYIWKRKPDKAVILDGRTFSRVAQRKHVIEFAETQHQAWRIVECFCDDGVARARLAQADAAHLHPAANRTPELYDEVKRRWEPITEPKIVVCTDEPLAIDEIARQLLAMAI
jgi:predicted kinase